MSLLEFYKEWKETQARLELGSSYVNNIIRDRIKLNSRTDVEEHRSWKYVPSYWDYSEQLTRFREHADAHKGRGQKLVGYLKQLPVSLMTSHDMTAEQYAALHEAAFYAPATSKHPMILALIAVRNLSSRGDWEPVDLMVLTKNSDDINYANLYPVQRLHNIHVSTADSNQIAYYPTLKHAVENKPLRTKIGRYLAKYAHLYKIDDKQIKHMADKHAANHLAITNIQLKYIENNDPHGWVDGYRDGPYSCMQFKENVRAYARRGNGLRLALLINGDGETVARCIVRDKDGKPAGYIRIYPDLDSGKEGRLLQDLIAADGYSDCTNLNGVEINVNREGDRYLVPYIDYGNNGTQYADLIDDEYFVIREGGAYELDDTDGIEAPDEDSFRCEVCDDRVSEDETNSTVDYDCVCDDCISARYTLAIVDSYGSREYIRDGDRILCQSDDEYYSREYAENMGMDRCSVSDDWYKAEDLVEDVATSELIHENFAVRLDIWQGQDVSEDSVYTNHDDVTTLSDGKVVHDDEAEVEQANIDMQLSLDFPPTPQPETIAA